MGWRPLSYSKKSCWCLLNRRLGCAWIQSGFCMEGKNSYIYQELNTGPIASYLADWEVLALLTIWKTRDFPCRMKHLFRKNMIINEVIFKNGMSQNMQNYFWITLLILLIKQQKNSATIIHICNDGNTMGCEHSIFWFSVKASTLWQYVI
jgi:hypothetical protein